MAIGPSLVYILFPIPIALSVPPQSSSALGNEHEVAGPRVGPTSKQATDTADESTAAWVFFTDKGIHTKAARDRAIENVASTYNTRAIKRRMLRRTAPGLFDERDIPVSDTYSQAVEETGAHIRTQSRWLNAVSVLARGDQIAAISKFPFVKSIGAVRRLRTDNTRTTAAATSKHQGLPAGSDGFYGLSEGQLSLINLIALHEAGFTGDGVVIGVLDTECRASHEAFQHPDRPLDVVAEWDFLNNDPVTANEPGDPPGQHNHGSYILGALGAYLPGELVGAAYDASYILCKVEDADNEYNAEEDLFVAGLEFIEANGGDVATSSVVIFIGYDQDDLDGQTSVMSRGVNVATENGLIVCQAGGNEGHDNDPSTSTLVPPADAFDAITVGAVTPDGDIANFSSDGPTADGRIKPEVLAQGVNVWTVSPAGDTGFTAVGGTSLATPHVAGVVACLLEAQPDWTMEQMRYFLFRTADFYTTYQTYDPTYVQGYGLINAFKAYHWDCNGNGVIDADDLGSGYSTDLNLNGRPDECDLPADFDGDDHLDARDYRRFTLCMSGPGIAVSRGCLLADADLDSDVDFQDFSAVQAAFTD